jgi:hypothetical protein
MKKKITPEELCSGLFPEMIEYLNYAIKLEFEQEPDYNYLETLFSRMLKRVHNTNDQLIFSWIKFPNISNLKNPTNSSPCKDSTITRIYKKIKSNLELEKKISYKKKGFHKKICTQRTITSPNLKVNNKDNYSECKNEDKNDKILNKKLLKFIELDSTISQIDATLDENIVSKYERNKRSSRYNEALSDLNNTFGSKLNNNKDNNNVLENSNFIINNNQKNENNKSNNEINNNINFRFNKKIYKIINKNLNNKKKDKLNSMSNDKNNDCLNIVQNHKLRQNEKKY